MPQARRRRARGLGRGGCRRAAIALPLRLRGTLAATALPAAATTGAAARRRRRRRRAVGFVKQVVQPQVLQQPPEPRLPRPQGRGPVGVGGRQPERLKALQAFEHGGERVGLVRPAAAAAAAARLVGRGRAASGLHVRGSRVRSAAVVPLSARSARAVPRRRRRRRCGSQERPPPHVARRRPRRARREEFRQPRAARRQQRRAQRPRLAAADVQRHHLGVLSLHRPAAARAAAARADCHTGGRRRRRAGRRRAARG
ncbi:MAG: hypothetical protein J3K34DRAFT_190232 [Monoraphidium minutum]|nr:MAG: hypothetical protein J3K34DRAFT_190232 [Monoraphidium minutum]